MLKPIEIEGAIYHYDITAALDRVSKRVRVIGGKLSEGKMGEFYITNDDLYKNGEERCMQLGVTEIHRKAVETMNGHKLVFIDKYGFPVEGFIGRPILTWLRRLIHTRKIQRYSTWLLNGGGNINFN